MINFESENKESVACNQEFIREKLGLIIDAENTNFLKLDIDKLPNKDTVECKENTEIDSPDILFEHFETAEIVESDKVCRPKGDTTFFTTAGVQHIETILRDNQDLEKRLFAIAQPVLRSQFMDKTKDGVSTSFVNFSVESVDSNSDEFISLSDKLIKLFIDQGADSRKLRFQVEDVQDRWGDRKFTKTVLTIYFNGIELGESIYIQDYPITKDRKVSITDIGFGVERVNWGIDNSKHYFPNFNEFYIEDIDSNKVTSIVDCVRSMVLIAGEGVKPSSHDHGYRLRQLSKRLVSRNLDMKIDIIRLVHISFEYWKKWGFKSDIDEDSVAEIIKSENDRNYNSLFLSTLEKNGGPSIYVDINQTTSDFLKQISFSLKSEEINKIIEKIK